MNDYRLAPAAESDLETVWRYTCTRWGSAQADRYTDLLTAAFAALAAAPMTAPACDHIRAGYRRRRVEHHVIYFRMTDDGITIVRILHERMHISRHL